MAQLKDSIITGDLRVTGTIYGTATSALAVKDKTNNNLTYLNYGASGMSTTSWVGSWDGYTLKAISPTNLKTTMSLNNVENTKLSTWTGSTAITTLGTISTGTIPWANISGKPDQATSWPNWNQILQSGAENINEGNSDVTDNTEIFTSYASNNGFADTNAKGVVYRRDAIKLYNYIKGKTDSIYATKTEMNGLIAAADAMVFKGTIGTGGTVTALPATHNAGWTYRVITAGTYANINCEVGDLIMCIADGTAANNAHWTVAQANLDGAVIGPASATNGNFALFDGTTGKLLKNSSYSPSSFASSGHTHTLSIAADSGTNALTLAHGTKYKLTAGGSSFIFTMPASGNTDTKQNIVLDTDVKAYITGVTTTPTGTAQALTGVADTGVYLTTQLGGINASIYNIDESAQIYYDPENEAIAFAFSGGALIDS